MAFAFPGDVFVMDIKITIKVGNTELTLTLDEAKNLKHSLDELFAKPTYLPPVTLPYPVYIPTQPAYVPVEPIRPWKIMFGDVSITPSQPSTWASNAATPVLTN